MTPTSACNTVPARVLRALDHSPEGYYIIISKHTYTARKPHHHMHRHMQAANAISSSAQTCTQVCHTSHLAACVQRKPYSMPSMQSKIRCAQLLLPPFAPCPSPILRMHPSNLHHHPCSSPGGHDKLLGGIHEPYMTPSASATPQSTVGMKAQRGTCQVRYASCDSSAQAHHQKLAPTSKMLPCPTTLHTPQRSPRPAAYTYRISMQV